MSLKHCHSVNGRYKLQSHDIIIEIWIYPTDIDISSTIILLVKIRPCLEVSLRFMWIRSRIMSGYFCLLFILMRVVNYIWTRRGNTCQYDTCSFHIIFRHIPLLINTSQ